MARPHPTLTYGSSTVCGRSICYVCKFGFLHLLFFQRSCRMPLCKIKTNEGTMEKPSFCGKHGIPVMGMQRGCIYGLLPGEENGMLFIRCLKGILWITQEGDGRDHVIQRGDVFFPKRTGSLPVQAIEKSFLQIGVNSVYPIKGLPQVCRQRIVRSGQQDLMESKGGGAPKMENARDS